MFKRKPKVLTPQEMEEIRTKDFFDCILPGTIKFLSDHYIVGDSYRCVWAIREYPPSTEEQARIDELTSMDSESAQNGDFDELFESLYTEMYAIKDELEDAEKTNAKLDAAVNRIDEMTTVMYGLKNHPVEYDEQIVRQLISSIKVISAEQILILFKDGTEMTADL